ncbi:MAG: nucleoside triphosphate pyrophosphohydrolase [Bacteroidota bacterium]|jgi:XTP/dITP diphosphohydrolase|nr:nucleoside triphosphate pyrophosphohydrolase [Bacteroidota bacterium]|tara:strand:+ start:556 stop:1326 length:771 start_codon:yes stop_codon:yes gene_type:complete
MPKNKFENLKSIIEELREKCPWDKKQTIKSLRALTIEEVYELSDAIISEDNLNIEEELGDVLLHIIFYSQIGKEKKLFSIDSVIDKLIAKLKERHPHVYGGINVQSSEEVEENWEIIKKKKKNSNKTLGNISKNIPPIVKAMRIQEKVRSVGFDWEEVDQVLNKIYEELSELKNEVENKNFQKIKGEVGDLLFSIINYSRFIGIDPEEALEKTNIKFIKRFNCMENKILKEGKSFKYMNLKEMDKYWEMSKAQENE